MDNIFTRLDTFIKAKNISYRAFEQSINVSNSAIATPIKKQKGSIGSDILSKIFDNYPDLNIEWLFTGKGHMLRRFTTVEDLKEMADVDVTGMMKRVEELEKWRKKVEQK